MRTSLTGDDRFTIDDGRNRAGDQAKPRVRARWQAVWSRRALELAWAVAYVDRTRSTYAINGWQQARRHRGRLRFSGDRSRWGNSGPSRDGR